MPLDFKKAYGYNKKNAQDGMWVSLDEENGVSIKVAKIGTVVYLNTVQKHARKYQALARVNRLTAEQTLEINAKTLADCILLDWKGVMEDGVLIEYSPANAYRILKEYDEFRNLVELHASDPELFQDNIIDMEADSKNSLTISNGT